MCIRDFLNNFVLNLSITCFFNATIMEINTDTEERELVLRLIRGDQQAFCDLYSMYKERLIYFAMKFIKSPDFAEDIFHDTFVAVWQTRQFIDPEKPFRTYIYTIMRNRLLNIIRNIDMEDRAKTYISASAINTTNETDAQVSADELRNIIQQAKNRLTPRQRTIFEMSREQNLTNKEIAEHLQISLATVNDHISNALKIIRQFIEKSGINAGCVDFVVIFWLLS